VARFLSPEWFDELAASSLASPHGPARATAAGDDGDNPREQGQVVEIVVAEAPEGEVRYQVVVEGTRVLVLSPRAVPRAAQVRLSSDYATMAAIASGELSALEALSAGRARVSGDISTLSGHPSRLAGLDLLPPPMRANTTF
jgi:hypothetical protein